MHRFYLIIPLFITSYFFSQNGITGNPDWFIKPSVNQGFILEHRSTIGHLVKGYPTIYEVNVGKPTLGDKLWHLENNMPDVGMSLSVLDFKNPAQLGYAFSIAPYAEIPLHRVRKTRMIMRLCWGVTYLNKCFDIKTNPKNIAIGSNINSFVQFKWFWHIPITKNIRFEPGFAFSHASNARAKVPNLGLNVVSLNAAFNYLIPSGRKP
ncbi:MAG: secreted protein, partial [Bacteroidetes bacterium]|nr:secreted protein [Bacteroidota bacterium]